MNHNEFRLLILSAFANRFGRPPTRSEAQCVHAVAELETSCGDGWADPEHDKAHNYGAIQAGSAWKNPDGSPKPTFGHKDSSPKSDGSSEWYEGRFRVYPTPLAGVEDLVRVVYQAKIPRGKGIVADRALLVLPPATRGETLGFSRALYETGYYEGFGRDAYTRIQHHHKALTGALDRICREIGELLPDGTEPARTPPRVLFYRPSHLMRGDDVLLVQRVVGATTDGVFGAGTRERVIAWQKAHKLNPDGKWGPVCRHVVETELTGEELDALGIGLDDPAPDTLRDVPRSKSDP